MTATPRFALLPIGELKVHEEVRGADLAELVASISREGVVEEPILVAEGSLVILNGHHRVEALRRLGAARVPAWVVDYDAPEIELDRWDPGPPISKREVVTRAREGRPFPPKTTRHRVSLTLPTRRTPLPELRAPAAG